MFDKKIVIFSIALPLIMSIIIYFISSDFVFKSIQNPEVFKVYENTKALISPEFIEAKANNREKFLFLYDSSEIASMALKNNFEVVFRYIKKEVKFVDVSKTKADFLGYSCIIIGLEKIQYINNFNWIFEYVKNGGSLIFAERPTDSSTFDSIYRKLGINEKGISVEIDSINIKTNILIKGNGLKRENLAISQVIPVQLGGDCKVHCVSNQGVPLIWERMYGKGKLVFVNDQLLQQKENRGLLVGTIALAKNVFIYPIINSKVDYIDDFPSPSSNEYDKGIYEEFGMRISNFYKEVWWPNMLKEAKLHNIKYSSYCIETYNDLVTMQQLKSDSTIEDKNNLIIFGRDLLKNGGEMGMHGYNHEPLALEGYIKYQDKDIYIPWENESTMTEAVNKFTNFIKSVYPEYKIRSYVPPSNTLSPEGRQLLKRALPDLKVISSLYIDSENSDSYIQEVEVAKDGIIELPRFSDGYKLTENSRWDIYNAITMHGLFSHFVHPDDILDPKRNFNENWSALFKDYEALQSEMNRNFHWLRPETISEAGVETMRYSDCNPVFKYEDNGITGYCQGFKKEAHYILRTENKIKKASGCEFSEIDKNVYEIRAIKPEFHIEWGDAK